MVGEALGTTQERRTRAKTTEVTVHGVRTSVQPSLLQSIIHEVSVTVPWIGAGCSLGCGGTQMQRAAFEGLPVVLCGGGATWCACAV